MHRHLRSAFIGPNGGLREGWFAVLFLIALTAVLAPLLVWSQQAGREISIAEQALIVLLVTWGCQRLRGKPLSEALGRFDARWPAEFGAGALLGGALMLAPALFLLLAGAVRWEAAATPAELVVTAIFAMLLVAVAEELLFRGFLFQRLIGAIGIWPAQLAMSGLFLLTHLNNPGMDGTTRLIAGANIFAASLLFGFAYVRTRSLGMAVGIHWMANVVQGPILGHGVSGNQNPGMLQPDFLSPADWLTGGPFGLEASVPGTLCVLAALYAAARWRRRLTPSSGAGRRASARPASAGR